MFKFNYIHMCTNNESYYYSKHNGKVMKTKITNNANWLPIQTIVTGLTFLVISYFRINGKKTYDIFADEDIKIAAFIAVNIIGFLLFSISSVVQYRRKVMTSKFKEVTYDEAKSLFVNNLSKTLSKNNKAIVILLIVYTGITLLYFNNVETYLMMFFTIFISLGLFELFINGGDTVKLYKKYKKGELVINNKKEKNISSGEISSDIFNKIE